MAMEVRPDTNRPRFRAIMTILGVTASILSVGALLAAMFWIGNLYFPVKDDTRDAMQKLLELRSADKARLNNYGWVNKAEKIVHIPIERAMRLIVEDPKRVSQQASINKDS